MVVVWSVVMISLLQAEILPISGPVEKLVTEGKWREAEQIISEQIQRSDISFAERQNLLFQRERMRRIRMDFKNDQDQTLKIIQGIVPTVDRQQFDRWDKQGSIESMVIDGQRWFFNRAGQNLFRVNPEARKLKLKHQPASPDEKATLKANLHQIIDAYHQTAQSLVIPKTYRITYTITVDSGVVPPGETVRAWLPFPRDGGRQSQIRLLKTEPELNIEAGNHRQQRTLYLENQSIDSKPMVFKAVFEYTASGFYLPVDPKRVTQVDFETHPELKPWIEERPPHIVFSDTIRSLAKSIAGQEQNPYLKARSYFKWINDNVTWASAREYSTLESICHYPLGGWGDCGIQTLLFMALCRSQSIPARWQSGWTTRPPSAGMHDWCQIYIEPYGWLPVDPSYGLTPDKDKTIEWFFFGNIDSYRLVVNDDYSRELYPVKLFYRSETVDFQRGELEYAGGNLYYDQWDWDYKVEEITR